MWFRLVTIITLVMVLIVGCTNSGERPPVATDAISETKSLPQAGAAPLKTPDISDLITPSLPATKPLPSDPLVATVTPESLETPEPAAQPTSLLLNDPAVDTPSGQPELNPCLSEVLDENGVPFLQWLPLANHTRQLAQLKCPIVKLDSSPDGRWLVITIENSVEFQVPNLSLLLVDIQDGKHLLLNKAINGWGHHFNWVSDSQLIWINEDGSVSIGNGDLSEYFSVPKPMVKVWYASANISFAKDEDGLWWRLDTETEQWQPLDNLINASGFGVSQDGSFGLLFGAGELWYLPTSWDGEAARIAAPDLSLVGTDAVPEMIILQLGDSSNWYISTPVWYRDEGAAYPLEGFVLDIEEQRFLLPGALGLPDTFKIVGFDVSPNGQWLAVLVYDKTGQSVAVPNGVYIAETNHLQSGRLIEDVIPAGWNVGDASVLSNRYAFLIHNQGDLLNIYGSLEVVNLNSEQAVLLPDVERVIGVSSQYVFVIIKTQPNVVTAFDLDGNSAGTFDVPYVCHVQEYSVFSAGGAAYLSLEGEQCPLSIVEFDPD